jgi:hypothetical protein
MWETMTVDEYAAFERANGSRVVEVDGVWWKMIRPFFFRPLHLFAEMERGVKSPPAGSVIGGFQHLLPGGEPGNSRLNLLLVDDVKGYSMGSLSPSGRKNIRMGMNKVAVKPIDDISEFISQGHQVYLEFYARTKYSYKKERVDRNGFAEWARTLYSFPKVRKLGAYRNGILCAISISYLVEDVLYAATYFANNESLKMHVSDFVFHTLREQAAGSENINCIYNGQLTGQAGRDAFKERRGVKVVQRQAYFRVNPLARFLLRRFMSDNFAKLTGATPLDGLEGHEGADGEYPQPDRG